MKKPKPARHRMTNPLKPGPVPGRGVRASNPQPPGTVRRAPQHGGKKPPHHHQPPPGRGRRMTNPLVPGGTVKRAGHHKRRGLALGEGVACCSAEALAMSLRLAGGAVSDEDVLALHYLAGGSENGGVSILAALEVASEFGLAGARPVIVSYWPGAITLAPGMVAGCELPGAHALLADGDTWWSWGEPYPRSAFSGAVIEEAWLVDWEG